MLSYATGAYEVAESAKQGGSASASVMGVGAEGSKAESSTALLRGGNLGECKSGGKACLAPVRLRLLPIIEGEPAATIAAVQQQAVTRPVPGTEKRKTVEHDALVRVFESLKPAILACRLEFASAAPRTQFRTHVQIGADGVVTAVNLESGGDTPFGKCVQEAFFSARFPRSKEPSL